MHEENQDKYSFYEKLLHFRERELKETKQIVHDFYG